MFWSGGQDDIKRNVTRLIGKGSSKFYLDKYALSDVMRIDEPLIMPFNWNYFENWDEHITTNFNKEQYMISLITSRSLKESDYNMKAWYCGADDLDIISRFANNAKSDYEPLGFETEYTSKNKIVFEKVLINFLLTQTTRLWG
jgi:hypothetical protein